MTKWHSLPQYKEMFPKTSLSDLNMIMVRDWKMGTISGLNAMRLPLVENEPDARGRTETQFGSEGSQTVTEIETVEEQFGLIKRESDGDTDCALVTVLME